MITPQPRPTTSAANNVFFYHPELDVLRFAAFLMVFLAHLDYSTFAASGPLHPFLFNVCFATMRAGASGMSLFFVLSAFLITSLLLQEQLETGTVHVRKFYVRRVLRIWPLYFCFLLIIRPLIGYLLPWEHLSLQYVLAFLLLAGNWIIVFRGVSGSFADPLWSISVEEQFYLVWPFVIRFLGPKLPAVAFGMLLLSNAGRIVMLGYPTAATGMWFNTLAQLDSFALGALAAFYLKDRNLDLSRGSRTMLIILSLVMLLATGRYGDHFNDRSPLTYPIESLSCAVLLIAVILPIRGWYPGFIGRAFVRLGKISYGLYVFHVFFIRLILAKTHMNFIAANGVALVLTIGAATLSYALIERPFLLLKQRFTYVKSRV